MKILRQLPLMGAAVLMLSLAACDTAEDRAVKHYERGMAFLETGEADKASLEFRNALQLDPDAVEARREFAGLLLASGNAKAAVGHFLQVIDRVPDDLETRLTVGRILLAAGQTDDAAEHILVAFKQAPEDPEAMGLRAMLHLRQGEAQAAADLARQTLDQRPGDILATMVLVEQQTARGAFDDTIALLDAGLSANPENFELHVSRLRVLERLDDQVSIGAQLEEMSRLFPDQPRVAQSQVQWFLNQGDTAGAIAAQRNVAKLFPDDPANALDVAALLSQFEGPEAAQTELQALAAGDDHKVFFTRALSDYEASLGDLDAAIARLKALSEAEGTDASDRNDIDTQRAGLLRTNDQQDEAKALIDKVLSADSNHVEALKLRASIAIDSDRPEDAIADLRQALSFRAQDPAILMLLANAHERNGSTSLAQERLALAVQASDAGVVESLTYADFLIRTQKPEIAVEVLEDALSKRGDVATLLIGLGNAQLAMSDWSGANVTAARLDALTGDDNAIRSGQELRLAVLGGQQKFDESIGLLRSMWDAEGERSSALENLVSSYLQTGQIDKARSFLDNILNEEPKNLRANLLLGAVLAFNGDSEAAEAQYRKVIEEHPERANGYGALATHLMSQGRSQEADKVLADGIKFAPDAERLMFFQASRLEEQGDFDRAISIYEQLYAANKLSDVLANNLASMLSEYRTDDASLERAFAIARRLRGNPEPAFQDTYGWILYLRGDYERALPPLQAAVDKASTNPIVLYHLGATLAKLGQTDQALDALERAVEFGSTLDIPQMTAARTLLADLKKGG